MLSLPFSQGASALLLLPILVLACASEPAPAPVATEPPGADAGSRDAPPAAPSGSAPAAPEPAAAPPAGPRWCATKMDHAFCADFDGSDATEGFSDVINALAIGSASIVADGRSAPSAVRLTQVQYTWTALRHDMAVVDGTRAAVELDIQADTLPEHPVQAISLILFLGDETAAATLHFGSNLTVLRVSDVEEVPGVLQIDAPPLTPGAWFHLKIDIERSAKGWRGALSLDGQAQTGERLASASTPATFDGFRLVLGAHSAPSAGAAPLAVTVDNVLADAE